jgi:hypothetical protein
MGETVAQSVEDFTNSNIMFYMNERVVEYRESFRLYVGDLSHKEFCESFDSKSPNWREKKRGNHDAEYAKIMGQKAKTANQYVKTKDSFRERKG